MSKTSAQRIEIEFEGKKAEQALAARAWELFRARGAFFSANAPISIPAAGLAEALAAMGEDVSVAALQSALDANPHVFARVDGDDGPIYITTRQGVPPSRDDGAERDLHMLPERFATPEPPREAPRAPKVAAAPESLTRQDVATRAMEFPPDSWQAAVAAALREAGQPSSLTGARDVVVDEAAMPEPVELIEAPAEEVEAVVEPKPAEAAPADTVVTEEPARPEPQPEILEELDVQSASDVELADAIERALRDVPSAVRWGDAWMHESNVPTLSKDDLNQIQEILGAADEAVSDYALVRSLRGDETPGSEAFELERFALNYRMSREMGLFEFVGTARQALWTSAGLQPIGSDKRKASEFGHDYRFLLDYRTPDAELEPGIVEHVLTFYEHYHGVLPLNANMTTILPAAAFNDQRATRLTFESPQTFETFEVELRYPTSNRGGYLIGFEEFFAENLVPGAVVTIEATRDRETHFIIEYFQISRQDRKLLQFNERRNRFVFQTTTYFCATQDDMLVDENHFERLADVEPLDEDVRRHADRVVAKTFERIGAREEADGEVQYRANLIDILAAANIERPIAEPFLRDILSGGAYPEFVPDDSDEDVYVYVAPAS
jgi:hypothetical protein